MYARSCLVHARKTREDYTPRRFLAEGKNDKEID